MVLSTFKKTLVKGNNRSLKHFAGGVDVSEVMMFREAEPRKILQTVIEKKVPAIMSYLSKGKWHVAKVLLTDLGATMLSIEVSHRREPRPINIQVEQPVGISLKHEYGKFIFETTIIGFGPPLDSQFSTSEKPNPATGGGTIILAVPNRIQFINRRSYFRVNLPPSLKVIVMIWHRVHLDNGDSSESLKHQNNDLGRLNMTPDRYWQGRLVDISAGGAQIVIDAAQKPDFRNSQFVSLRFTPLPYETPLMFNAQIRNILPTVGGKNICIGLQVVGLEASSEGRDILQRLCNVVERYHRMNQSGIEQQDMQPISIEAAG